MTASQIKRALRRNRREGRRPWSLYQIAQIEERARSMVTTAVKYPGRYPKLRTRIESYFVNVQQKKQNGAPERLRA